MLYLIFQETDGVDICFLEFLRKNRRFITCSYYIILRILIAEMIYPSKIQSLLQVSSVYGIKITQRKISLFDDLPRVLQYAHQPYWLGLKLVK